MIIRGITPVIVLTAIACSMMCSIPHAYAQPRPGDILVVDPEAGTNRQGALFSVDPVSGERKTVHDFGKGDEPHSDDPIGVAVSASGEILVIDPDAGTDFRGALFSVNPATDDRRTLIHDFGSGDEPLGANPSALAVAPSGDILVIDSDAGTGQPIEEGDRNGALFRVVGSSREVVTDNLGEEPRGVALRGLVGQEILVTERGFEFADFGGLFIVNPPDAPNQPPRRPIKVVFSPPNYCLQGNTRTSTTDPSGVALEPSGTILITDPAFNGRLHRVDLSAPVGRQCRVLSDFGDDSQGTTGSEPLGVAVNASGDIFVVDPIEKLLFRVNPDSGHRTVLSDFRNTFEGPRGQSPSGIAIISGQRPVEATKPLIFIPGIAGSELDEDLGEIRRLIWPFAMLQFEVLGRLTLDSTKEQRQIVAADAIRTAVVDVPTGLPIPIEREEPIYRPLLDVLIDPMRGGYREYHVQRDPAKYTTAGCDLTQKHLNPTLFVFPYDWRKSNIESAAALNDYVGCIQQFYPNTEVDILAHSMGGLVARRYILDNAGTHRVRKLITIGTPWLGASKSFYLMETGDFIVSSLPFLYTLVEGGRDRQLLKVYKALVEFFSATHQLLPSRPTFSVESQFVEDGWDINRNGVKFEKYTYDQFIDLVNRRFRSAPGTTSQEFHDNLGQDDWRNDDSNIEYAHIVGLKKHADTLGDMKAARFEVCSGFITKTCIPRNAIGFKIVAGDGTVPLFSAERRKRDFSSTPPMIVEDINAQGSRVAVFFNLPNDGSEHTRLTMNRDVHDEMLLFLGRGRSALLTGSQALVLRADQETIPPPVEPAYYLKIIGAIDITVTDVLSSIPQGVTSYLAGDEDSRLIIMDLDREYTITFRSSSNPVAIEITKGTDVTTTMAIRYQDLDLPAEVMARLKVTPQAPLGIETLKYDSDGDGTFETEVTPTVEVEGPEAEDVEAPTIEFSATVQSGKVLVDITAEDSNTGVKGLFYSLDGTNFLRFTGTLSLDPAKTTLIDAFADDNVGNRSSTVTFQIPSTTVTCGGRTATKVGTMGNDIIDGTNGPDIIHGLSGNDVIRGLGANDTICGGEGNDRLIGGNGNDQLLGERGDDDLQGSVGNDRLDGGDGNDHLKGHEGDDQLRGGSGDDALRGLQGKDTLAGEHGNDSLRGGPDPDTLNGGPGADKLNGGSGTDTCTSDNEDEVVVLCEADHGDDD